MADPVYYKLTVGGNSFYFFITNISNNMARELWELPIPYVRDELIYDQITTTDEIQVTGEVRCGSGYPYNTPTLARAAARALAPDSEITSVTLVSGTWNGATFTPDASYNWNLPDSGKTAFLRELNIVESPDGFNILKVTATLVQGAQL
jgi:hypothetical protein